MLNTKPINSKVIGYAQKSKDVAFSIAADKQLELRDVAVVNNSGGVLDLGVLLKLNNASFSFGQYDDSAAAGSQFIDDTTDAQTDGTDAELFSTTVDDGFIVASSIKFGLFGMTISQAQGGTPVYAYEYWNGSAFVTLPTVDAPSFASTADTYLSFMPPHDWATGGLTDSDLVGKYIIRAQATTATSTQVNASHTWVGEWLDYHPQVADHASLSISYPENRPKILAGGESVMPYYSTANGANFITVTYGVRG